MHLLALALRNTRRRRAHVLVSGAVLGIAVLALMLVLGHLNGTRARLRFIQQHDLYRMGLLGPMSDPEPWKLTQEQASEALASVVATLKQQPGITAVGVVHGGGVDTVPVSGSRTHRDALFVNADLAGLMPASLLTAGRWFTPSDGAGNTIPIVVNSRLRKQLPIGHQFEWQPFWDSAKQPVTLQVVGLFDPDGYVLDDSADHLEAVLPSARSTDLIALLPAHAQAPYGDIPSLLVGAASEQTLQYQRADMVRSVTEVLAAHSIPPWPDVPVSLSTMREMEESYRHRMREPLVNAVWLTGLVLALTIFGFGSVNAISVHDRKQELGAHFACGASRRSLIAMILIETAVPLAFPAAVGALLVGAFRALGNPLDLRIDLVVLGQALLILAGIAAVCSAAPVLLIRSASAAALIRGLEED